MAKFTLSLLTTVADSSSNGYTRTIITEYVNNRQAYAERKKPAASLIITYNEKLSLHQNSQKELTFNMLRKLNLGDDWVLNPYVDQLHVGSLLELEDKYGRVSLFIINKIAFAFKSINLEYQYTCQDAFSYQHSRQQSGYTITNDASKDDYIGPKSLD